MKRDHMEGKSSRPRAITGEGRGKRTKMPAPARRTEAMGHKGSISPISERFPISTLQAQEDERKRMSRELHDEMGQGLMTLRLYLGSLVQGSEGTLKLKAQDAMDLLDHTIDGLRRIIARLSPRPLEELGLVGAIRKEVQMLSKRSGMKPHVELPRDWRPLDHEIEMAVYRSVQEGLNNIGKHSAAQNFGVALERSFETLSLRIEDDGTGLAGKVQDAARTFGIRGMRERIEEVNGTLRIFAPKGGGTCLEIEIPLSETGAHHGQAGMERFGSTFETAS